MPKKPMIMRFVYEWGSRGRWFKSSHSDQKKSSKCLCTKHFGLFSFFAK